MKVLVPSLLLSVSLSTLLLSVTLCCCLPRQTKPIFLYSVSGEGQKVIEIQATLRKMKNTCTQTHTHKTTTLT